MRSGHQNDLENSVLLGSGGASTTRTFHFHEVFVAFMKEPKLSPGVNKNLVVKVGDHRIF